MTPWILVAVITLCVMLWVNYSKKKAEGEPQPARKRPSNKKEHEIPTSDEEVESASVHTAEHAEPDHKKGRPSWVDLLTLLLLLCIVVGIATWVISRSESWWEGFIDDNFRASPRSSNREYPADTQPPSDTRALGTITLPTDCNKAVQINRPDVGGKYLKIDLSPETVAKIMSGKILYSDTLPCVQRDLNGEDDPNYHSYYFWSGSSELETMKHIGWKTH